MYVCLFSREVFGNDIFDGLDGTVTQHDGKFLAVDRFPFFDGKFLAVDGKSNFDGIFTAVTQHDGNFLAVDGFPFLTVTFWR